PVACGLSLPLPFCARPISGSAMMVAHPTATETRLLSIDTLLRDESQHPCGQDRSGLDRSPCFLTPAPESSAPLTVDETATSYIHGNRRQRLRRETRDFFTDVSRFWQSCPHARVPL